MLRIAAIFVAVCVIFIAASVGAIVYLIFGMTGAESSIVALAVLLTLAIFNMISSRMRDRARTDDQIADLSRGTADLSRQLAEFGRRLAVVESDRFGAGRAKAGPDPLAAEIGELGGLIKQLAETVASHEATLAAAKSRDADPLSPAPSGGASAQAAAATPPGGPFKDKSRDEMLLLIREAVDANRIDLYLQPILTLPQRKVRYYEGMTRLRTAEGDLMLPADFLPVAEPEGLMPRIDNLLLFRCVQVLRRLLSKNREIGLFCNISASTLHDPRFFQQFSQFMEANRALAPSLMLEFSQSALNGFGPIEQENMAALAELGFRFSMDQVTDVRLEPRNLAERGIRFVKVPATLLLNRNVSAGDIHTADLSDLLGRHGISLIAEKIETEAVVVDLLDFDVRFGQGFLFSPPRPVRAEALSGVADRNDVIARDDLTAPVPASPARRTDSPGVVPQQQAV
jgi:cyclic-di-GMP phosphodiesterase TipF (flagellum assembly factor)